MSHIVLLGDSIFDNGVYVAPDPDVIRQLRSELPTGWSATLLAVDGHITIDVLNRQLPRLPADPDYLVLSVGGNDALGQSGVLAQPATTVAAAVALLDRAARSSARITHACSTPSLQPGCPLRFARSTMPTTLRPNGR